MQETFHDREPSSIMEGYSVPAISSCKSDKDGRKSLFLHEEYLRFLRLAIRYRAVQESFEHHDTKAQPAQSLPVDTFLKQLHALAARQDLHILLWPCLRQEIRTATSRYHGASAALGEAWDKQFRTETRRQLHVEMEMHKLFTAFEQTGIAIMPFKGEALRNLYPYPEARLMCDCDVLIRPEDRSAAEKILTSLHYSAHSASQKHVEYVGRNNLIVEMHLTLIDERFQDPEGFTATVWNTSRVVLEKGTKIHQASTDLALLQLLMHHAAHLMSSGPWLRQLCDIVLLLEKAARQPDFADTRERFLHWCNLFGLSRFMTVTLRTAEYLLELDVSRLFPDLPKVEDSLVESHAMRLVLLQVSEEHDIDVATATNVFSYYSEGIDPASLGASQKGNRLLQFLFPSRQRIPLRYEYAKKHPVLMPVAWGHRLLHGLARNDFPLSTKINILTKTELQKRPAEAQNHLKQIGLIPHKE